MFRFLLFGVPVGVHVTFLVVALLGATVYRGWDIAWWTVAAFLSILLHELGHALSARRFGATDVSITLYGLGGLTTYRHGREIGHGRSFIISAAGSFVGIVAGGLVYLAVRAGLLDGAADAIVVVADSFVFTALIWGVLNWIPVVPLDGGHMVQHLVSMFDEERAPLIGQIVTWVTLAVLIPLAWINGYRFAVLILVFFAFAGFREYRSEMDRRERQRAAERAADGGSVAPDEILPAPPGPPTPPDSGAADPRNPYGDETGRGSRSRRTADPPEFPI